LILEKGGGKHEKEYFGVKEEKEEFEGGDESKTQAQW